jgi:hypothetical protein
MGFLTSRRKLPSINLVRLPNGSFTVSPAGQVLVSTLPGSFPQAWTEEIGKLVVTTFRAAEAAHLTLHEMVVEYSALRVTARALRDGAIIFLAPQAIGRR